MFSNALYLFCSSTGSFTNGPKTARTPPPLTLITAWNIGLMATYISEERTTNQHVPPQTGKKTITIQLHTCKSWKAASIKGDEERLTAILWRVDNRIDEKGSDLSCCCHSKRGRRAMNCRLVSSHETGRGPHLP